MPFNQMALSVSIQIVIGSPVQTSWPIVHCYRYREETKFQCVLVMVAIFGHFFFVSVFFSVQVYCDLKDFLLVQVSQ